MSQTVEHDHVTHRLVIALDALPVPEEPTGLTAAKPSLLRAPRMLLAAALLLVLVATLTSPQFQQAAAELTKYSQRILVGPGTWVGYYHDHTPVQSVALRLLVASGSAQGEPLTPDMAGASVVQGRWSPDRRHIAVGNGSELYVGDQFGRLRRIADLGLGKVVVPWGWVGNDKVWATVSPMPNAVSDTLVAVDVKTGSLEYHRPDSSPGGPFGPISPDGRWVTVMFGPRGTECGFIMALYDLVTRQVVDVVDADGRSASGFGFLSDGRIVVGQCDRNAGTLELYVGAPGTRPSFIAALPIAARRPVVALGKGTDEIHVITSGPGATQNANVFDPSGRLLRRTQLPQLALARGIEGAGLSGDGRFMSFGGTALVGIGPRAGVIDLATGHVTYLCDRGCDELVLR